MRRISLNQFNQWVATNEVVRFYKSTRATQSWRNKYFNTKRGSDPTVSNSMYAGVHKLAKVLTGVDTWNSGRKRGAFEVVSELVDRTVYFTIYANLDPFEGAHMRVDVDGLGRRDHFYFPIHSNLTWQEFDAIEYFKKHLINAILLPEGRYREIQMYYRKPIRETLEIIRDDYQFKRKPLACDAERAIIKRLKKKRNIIIVDNFDFTSKRLMSFFDAYPKKFAKAKKIVKGPNPFDLLDGFDGDVDDVEALVYSEFSKYDADTIVV